MKKEIKLMFLLLVAMTLTACQSKPQLSEQPVQENQNIQFIDSETIYRQFIEENTEAKVKKIKFALDDKQYIYEVEGFFEQTEIEARYDAITGNLIKKETDQENDSQKEISLTDLQAAKTLLEAAFKDVNNDKIQVKSWSVSYDDHRKEFEVTFIDENNHDIEYEYDLESKELIKKDF